MRYLFFLMFFFIFYANKIFAQQNHFLYFQSEGGQLFYVKFDNAILNSSSSGYLIVPKLKDGVYHLAVGSPKNEWPEVAVDYALQKDAGFVIKNFTGKGWGLFDLQSLNVIMPQLPSAKENTNEAETKSVVTATDNFSEMLSEVVSDSTIKQKDIVEKKEVPEDKKTIMADKAIVDTLNKQDDVVISKSSDLPKDTIQNMAVAQNVFNKKVPVLYSLVNKSLQQKSNDGTEMIYTDEYDDTKDTIRIFIPAVSDPQKNEQTVLPEKIVVADTSNNIVLPGPATDKASVEMKKNDTVEVVMQEPELKELTTKKEEDKIDLLPAKTGMPNSNCRQYASEEDFLKLRKKMAAENSDDAMIIVAKKIFKTKCFATKDIKNLSALFLNDQGRYNFFDAAYAYVSDTDVFYTLEKQLTDEYYINRFKAMLHH